MPSPAQKTKTQPARYRPWLLGVLGACVMASLINATPAFKECIKREKGDATYQQLRKDLSVVVGAVLRLELHTVCVEDWTEKYEGAIGAVATIFIAVFTLTLWKATDKLYEAAENDLTAFKGSMIQNRTIANEQIVKMGEYVQEAANTAIAMRDAANEATAQTKLIGAQTDSIDKQKEILRQTFILAHRPRIIFREAFTDAFLEGKPITVFLGCLTLEIALKQ